MNGVTRWTLNHFDWPITSTKLGKLPKIYVLMWGCVPPLWPTYIGENGKTLGKPYEIKLWCYWEHIWEHGGHTIYFFNAHPQGGKDEPSWNQRFYCLHANSIQHLMFVTIFDLNPFLRAWVLIVIVLHAITNWLLDISYLVINVVKWYYIFIHIGALLEPHMYM